GNLNGTIGGNLMAQCHRLTIDNRFKGFIGNGGNIAFNVTGTTNVAGTANFTILNGQTGTVGGTIGNAATINVTLADANLGSLNGFIDNTDASIGATGDEGKLTFQINGKLTVTNRIDVFGTPNVTGAITAQEFSVTNVNAPSISVGTGGITRFTFPSEPIVLNLLHTIT